MWRIAEIVTNVNTICHITRPSIPNCCRVEKKNLPLHTSNSISNCVYMESPMETIDFYIKVIVQYPLWNA